MYFMKKCRTDLSYMYKVLITYLLFLIFFSRPNFLPLNSIKMIIISFSDKYKFNDLLQFSYNFVDGVLFSMKGL